MELWIRSQDRECLMKVDRIDYDYSALTHRIMANGYKTLIGSYETKERALEVLDEIQKKIKMLIYLKPNTLLKLEDLKDAKEYFELINKQEFITCDRNFEIIPFSTNVIVYEMPKE